MRALSLCALFFSLLIASPLYAQEAKGAVLILLPDDNAQTFELEIKASNGATFKCPQIVSSRNPCRLEGLPPGDVVVFGKIGEKPIKELPLKLSDAGAQVRVKHEGYGVVIVVGVVAALSAATLAFELANQNVAEAIEASVVLAACATYITIDLLRGRDSLIANGKKVKKDGSLRAGLSPVFLEESAPNTNPSIGLGLTFAL